MGLVGPAFVGGTGALAFLLAAEVAAARAVVSEAALVYVARYRNLMLSLATIVLQGVLTVAGMLLVEHLGLGQLYRAAAAAAALMLSLGFASLAKGLLVSRLLGEPVRNWRWPLVVAAAPAIIVGVVATRYLPEWAELAFGVPAILFVYGAVVWRTGFGPEDRAPAPEPEPEPAPSTADDLSRIKGLGPKLQALLPTLGITTYAQIAALTEADLAELDTKLGAFAGRPAKDNWVEQAKFLAAGDTAGFEAKFGKV
jgi:hypothetical protein